jgi:hypothetical protein
VFGKLHVSARVGAELVVESSDTSLGAYCVVYDELDKTDDARLAPAVAEVLVGADRTEVAEDKAVGAFDARRGVHSDHAEPVVSAEEGYELLCDGSGEVGARVRGNLVVGSVGDEEGEEGLRHTDGGVVLGRIEGTEISEVVYHDMNTDVSGLVRWRAMEGVDAYAGAGMRWLEVLGDGLDGVLVEHTSGVLLAYGASCHEVNDLSVVYAVARVELVQVGSSLSGGAVLAVVDVASLEGLGHWRKDC